MSDQPILGYDPSLTGTALCFLDPDCKTIQHVETLVTGSLRGLPRLLEIENRSNTLIQKYNPQGAFIEGYGFGARGRAVFSLGELGGILRRLMFVTDVPYWDVPPTTLKKFITGKGNANKNILLEQTFRRYGIGSEVLTDDNQVDAFGLAKLGCAYLNLEKKLAKYQEEALKGVGKCITLQ